MLQEQSEFDLSSVVHMTSTAVNLTKSIAR